MSRESLLFAAYVGALALAVAGLLLSRGPSEQLVRRLGWLGVVMAFIYESPKSVTEAAGGPGKLDLLRGIGPAALLVLAFLLRNRRVKLTWQHFALGAYLSVALLSTAWSANPRTTLLKAGSLITVYLLVVLIAAHYDSLRELANGITSFCSVLVAVTAAELVLVPGRAFRPAALGDVRRLYTVVPTIGTNVVTFFAGVTCLAMITGHGPAWLARNRRLRLLLFAVAATEIALTRTRSVLLIFLVVLAYVVVRQGRRSMKLPFVAAISVAGASLALQTLVPVLTAYVTRGQSRESLGTLTGRTLIWRQARTVWETRPNLGFGFYSGHRFVLQGLPGVDAYSNIDNTWLETLVDVGYLGIVPLAAFMAIGLVHLLRVSRHVDLATGSFARGVGAALLATSFINPTLQLPSSTLAVGGVLLLGFGAWPVSGTAEAEEDDEQLTGLPGLAGQRA